MGTDFAFLRLFYFRNARMLKEAGRARGRLSRRNAKYLSKSEFKLVDRAGGNAGGGSVNSLLAYSSVPVFKWQHVLVSSYLSHNLGSPLVALDCLSAGRLFFGL